MNSFKMVLFLTLSAVAWAQGVIASEFPFAPILVESLNLKSIRKSIEIMKARGIFPEGPNFEMPFVYSVINYEKMDDVNSLPTKRRKYFKSLNRVATGSESTFRFRWHSMPIHSAAYVDVLGRTIYLLESYVPKTVDEQKFILAHELSHYLYDYWIQYFSANALSPNGQKAYGMDCREYPEIKSVLKANPNLFDDPDFVAKFKDYCFQLRVKKHAEVDAFAVVLLKKMGGVNWRNILEARAGQAEYRHLKLTLEHAGLISNP